MKTKLLILLVIGIFGFTSFTFAQEQSLPLCTNDRDACMYPPICENIMWDCPPSDDIFDMIIESSSEKELVDPYIRYLIELETGSSHGGSYTINNAIVNDVIFSEEQSTLIFTFEKAGNGHLQIMIASGLFYPMHLEYQSEYVVSADGMEIEFIQHSPIVLEIPFKEGTKKISIVGGFYPTLEKENASTVPKLTEDTECEKDVRLVDDNCIVDNTLNCDLEDPYDYECGVSDAGIDMTNGFGVTLAILAFVILAFVILASIIIVGFLVWRKRK